jgi:Domain of unknown function (DUF4397)
MFRLLKILPLLLAFIALSIFSSCGSSHGAQVRVVNAIPDAAANLDININGTKDFPNVAFDTVYPTQTTPASYVSVPSGSVTIEAFNTGTTSNPVVNSTTASLSGSTQYTLLLAGFLNNSPQAFPITDNNTAPSTGDVKIRIIDGSAVFGANGIDVAIYQTGLTPPSSPQIMGLSLGQASDYQSLTFESSYTIEVFRHGNGTGLFTFTPPTGFVTGEIMTMVIVDAPGGGTYSPTPLVMTDLN